MSDNPDIRARVKRVPDWAFYPWYRLVWWLDRLVGDYADALDEERRRRYEARRAAR